MNTLTMPTTERVRLKGQELKHRWPFGGKNAAQRARLRAAFEHINSRKR